MTRCSQTDIWCVAIQQLLPLQGKVARHRRDGRVIRRMSFYYFSTMNTNPKHNLVYLKPVRKYLRYNLTPAEAALWSLLKNSQLEGRRFRRQHSIDNFVVDFYCPSENLIVELDGEIHNNPDQLDKDVLRDKKLEAAGFTVLRFENKFVFEHREQLLNDIRACFKKQK